MKRWYSLSLAAILVLVVAALIPTQPASAAAACSISYVNRNDWGAGASIDVTITNTGDTAYNGWTITWSFSGNQTITQLWNGSYTQSGTSVSVTNLGYNGTIGANGGSQMFGFNLAYSGTNAAPASFSVNGVACGGSGGGATATRTRTPTRTNTPGGPTVTRTRTPTRTNTPGGPTATRTRTPTRTNTPGSGGTHLDNPFTGARWYINQSWQGRSVYNVNTFVWLDSIAAAGTLATHLDAAVAQGANLIGIVIYDLPNRDCAALASNGELLIAQDGLNRYRTEYIDPIIATIGSKPAYANLRIVAVIEPDSLPNLVTNLSIAKCSEANSSGAYVQGIQYAINRLNTFTNVYMYVDIAHSGWLGWSSNFGPAADLISNAIKGTTRGVNSIDGFVSNTAGYTPVEEVFLTNPTLTVGGVQVMSAAFYEYNPYLDERDFDTDMRNAFISRGFPSTIGMLIDTSRNGWGGSSYGRSRPTAVSTSTDLNTYVNASRLDRRYHRGNWCNQAGGIGIRPVASPFAGFDAFVWVKPPGESDGTSNSSAVRFDAMCDPNGQSRYNSAYPTGALSGAPEAGQWFQAAFDILRANQYP